MSFDNYCKVNLENIVTIKGGKRLPKEKNLTTIKTNYPYIRVKDISDKRILELNKDFMFIDNDTRILIKNYIVSKGDIIISIVGSIGFIALIGNSLEGANLTENCVKLTNFKGVNNDYLYYYLISKYGQQEISKSIVGAVQQKLPIKNINKIKINLPPLEEQKAIAKTLSCLDDKIELNNKINKNLEEMAQAIFKKWFVDFDYPLTEEEIANGGREFVDSELGKIPKGWKVGKLGDIITLIIGGDWGKDNEQGNYIKSVFCIRGTDIPKIENGEIINLPNRFIINKNFELKKLLPNDIIIEISGGSPTQSTGRVTIIKENFLINNNLICSNFCRIIRSKSNFYNFIYYYLKFIYDKEVMFIYENGTTGIKNLDIKNLLKREIIIIPSLEIVYNFNIIIDSIKNKIISNSKQNKKLTQIRDTLLPKLMNGDIRVI